MRTRATDRGAVERDGVVSVGNLAGGVDGPGLGARALRAVEQLVLEDQHRIVVTHGRLKNSLGVVGVETATTLIPGTPVK